MIPTHERPDSKLELEREDTITEVEGNELNESSYTMKDKDFSLPYKR